MDPWTEPEPDNREKGRPKTFWLKESTATKYEAVVTAAPNPNAVTARVKQAIEIEVEKMFQEMQEKIKPNSLP